MIDSDGEDIRIAQIIAHMNDNFETHSDWAWHAVAVEHSSWYQVWQQGKNPEDILIGGRTFVGPDNQILELSSNPFIHGFKETDSVLSEFGDSKISSSELAEEINRRTNTAR